MSNVIVFDDKLQSFFEVLYEDAHTAEQCVANVSKAVGMIADGIRLGRAHVKLEVAASKLRPERIAEYDLYNCKAECCDVPCVFVYRDSDGSRIEITLFPKGEPYTEEDKKTLNILSQQAYIRYSRTVTEGLLDKVMFTDVDTGVASPPAIMRLAGMYIAMHKLQGYVVIFFNIHNFKYVNKVFTYEEGDKILRKYATVVNGRLGEGEILARLGGDNFVALVRRDNANSVLNYIKELKLSHTAGEKSKEFVFGATVGVSELEDCASPREMMKRASIAYQAARQQGGGFTVIYSKDIGRRIMERQAVLSNFAIALKNREFVVYYQPKVNIKDKSLYGAEALVRWFHDGKLVPPMDFVPLLEQEGSICALDYYVLEEVCRFLSKRLDEGKSVCRVSVNFSRRHLDEDDLIERIVSTIDKYCLDHKYIEIELTESEEYQNFEVLTSVVDGLKKYDIGTSMDDFGTGFSSLNMIKKVDLNVIKLDKSFIPLENDYPEKKNDVIMFRHIVDMLNQLGKETVAEGVETHEQLKYLEEAGCGIVQGYIFDKPLPEEEFVKRLENGYN